MALSSLGSGELRFGVSERLVDLDVDKLSAVDLDLDPVVDSGDHLGGKSDWVPGVEGSSEVALGVSVVLGRQGGDLWGDWVESGCDSSAKHFPVDILLFLATSGYLDLLYFYFRKSKSDLVLWNDFWKGFYVS